MNDILIDPETNFIDLKMDGGCHYETRKTFDKDKRHGSQVSQEMIFKNMGKPYENIVKADDHSNKKEEHQQKDIEYEKFVAVREETRKESEMKTIKNTELIQVEEKSLQTFSKEENNEHLARSYDQNKRDNDMEQQTESVNQSRDVNQDVMDAANALFSLSNERNNSVYSDDDNQLDGTFDEDLHYFEDIDEERFMQRLRIIDEAIYLRQQEGYAANRQLTDDDNTDVNLSGNISDEDRDSIEEMDEINDNEEDDPGEVEDSDESSGVSFSHKMTSHTDDETKTERKIIDFCPTSSGECVNYGMKLNRSTIMTSEIRSRSTRNKSGKIVVSDKELEETIDSIEEGRQSHKRLKMHEIERKMEKFSPTPSDISVNSKENDTTYIKNSEKGKNSKSRTI